MKQESYFDQIVGSFQRSKPKPHTPRFRIEKERLGWRLFDGDHAIGLFLNKGWFAFDIWSFSPFEPDAMANVRPPGKVIDLHTMHNTALNLPITVAREFVEGISDPFSRLKTKWIAGRGSKLDLEIRGEFDKGQRVAYHFCVAYDPKWARYRFFLDADVWKLTYEGLEPINMMMAGALASRPERRRWTHSVWEDPNGQLKRLVHSNALFTATDYASNGNGEWRSKNAPHHRAWIAYAAHKTFNPAVLIHETSGPVFFATCSQLFDEHIIWQKAGLDQLDQGYFHFTMRTELVNLCPKLASHFLQCATDPPRPKRWRLERIALPFRMDEVNSFEKPLDPWQPEDGPILVVDPALSSEPICWDSSVGHSGSHSIRLEGRGFHHWTTLFPIGAVCNVEPHARYHLSAWAKTKNVDRFARIELATYEYTYSNVIDSARSAKLGGGRDWTLLQAELDTNDEAYVMPRLALYGTGTVWFDDVKLERIS
ncbi:MAG: hypothetical protein HY360_04065 [Verrucomicrobia bacterium]|nr:hypothetical protein [Verrucomicrobiota bacterium]